MNDEQLTLPMLTWYAPDKPRLVPIELVRAAESYRDAVRACWALRSRRNMKPSVLAELTGMLPSHLSDYLSDKPDKRDMPAKYVETMELACGNRFITQWFTARAELTHMEQVLAERKAA
jgi:hypothetical protein